MRAQSRLPVVAVAAVASALATGIVIQVSSLKLNLRRVAANDHVNYLGDHSDLLRSLGLTTAERQRHDLYYRSWAEAVGEHELRRALHLSSQEAEFRSHADAKDHGRVTAPSVQNVDSSVVRALTVAESELLQQHIPISELQQWPMESLEQRMAALMNLLVSQDELLTEQDRAFLRVKIAELSDVMEEQAQLERALELSLQNHQVRSEVEDAERKAAIEAVAAAEAERVRIEEAELQRALKLSLQDQEQEAEEEDAERKAAIEAVAAAEAESVRIEEKADLQRALQLSLKEPAVSVESPAHSPYSTITSVDLTNPVVNDSELSAMARAYDLAGVWSQPRDNSCGFHAIRQAMMADAEDRRQPGGKEPQLITVKDLRVDLRNWCVPVMSAILGAKDGDEIDTFIKTNVDSGCAGFASEDINSWANEPAFLTIANVHRKEIIVLNKSAEGNNKVHKYSPDKRIREMLDLDVEGVDDIQTIVLDSDFKRVEVEAGYKVDTGHFDLFVNNDLLKKGAYKNMPNTHLQTTLVTEALPDANEYASSSSRTSTSSAPRQRQVAEPWTTSFLTSRWTRSGRVLPMRAY